MKPNNQPKIRDHVGLLQDSFGILLSTMFSTIGRINADATSTLPAEQIPTKLENLPELAEQIVMKVKEIDAIIDEANQDTCIGKNVNEIVQSLEKKSEEYDQEVNDLSRYCEQAELWLGRIKEMLNVIAENTPWIQ